MPAAMNIPTARISALSRSAASFLALLLLGACSGQASTPLDTYLTTEGPPPPDLDPAAVEAGTALYQAHCASCHGADLSGAPNWQTPNPDGSYPPPPQDSSGHTWHHSDQLLLALIRDGSDFEQSRMPAFGDRLTDEEILSILDFFKSEWGERERNFQWDITMRDAEPLAE